MSAMLANGTFVRIQLEVFGNEIANGHDSTNKPGGGHDSTTKPGGGHDDSITKARARHGRSTAKKKKQKR
jgi:hypothetical protein